MEVFERIYQSNPILVYSILAFFSAVILVAGWIIVVQGREMQLWGLKVGANSESRKHLRKGAFSVDKETYYKSYYRMIDEAEQLVKIVGDGFACHGKDNTKDAIGLIDAMKSATKRGVIVKRFQFHSTISICWLNMLIDLQKEAGAKFQLYMKRDLDPGGIPYVICIIDENLKRKAEANIMFTKRADTGLVQKKAGPAFLAKNRELTVAMSYVTQEHFLDSYRLTLDDLVSLRDSIKTNISVRIEEYLADNRQISLDETSIIQISNEIGALDIDIVKDLVIQKLNTRGLES